MTHPAARRLQTPARRALAALGALPALWCVQALAQAPAPAPAPAASPAPARAAAAGPRTAPTTATASPAPSRTACTSLVQGPAAQVPLGKSQVIALGAPAARLIGAGRPTSWIGQPVEVEEQAPARGRANTERPLPATSDGVADTEITLLSPTELLVVGRRPGTANVIVQDREGRCTVRDIVVTIDPAALQAKLGELMPAEREIRVSGADNAIVLTGTASDAMAMDQAVTVATAYGDGKKVVNLMRVSSPSQVMLEVKIAEVSKNIIDRFGLDYSRAFSSGNATNVISGIVGATPGAFGRFSPLTGGGAISGSAGASVTGGIGGASAGVATTSRGATLLGLDLQKQDGIVRVLAEPNILAVSGQTASFLSGGKIFIPVAQNNSLGLATITLAEKEFGVGLKFTPTVLDGGRINLKLVSEASELSQTGSPFTTVGNATAILPSMTTRRVDTTVQLGDGQSFVVAGLVKNNLNETLKRVPGLGEVPVLGALFRSNEFQTDQTELMFVVTPRLVRPLPAPTALPTDRHQAPDRHQAIFGNAGEAPAAPAAPAQDSPAKP
ncbi:type II and III secretion system protein family protein [Ramlibacter sp. MAHUQ-53]|uniref:type II and III secretion system protein family protein n=1 Tax=unclassified Ramlibacter TaxID=2617605 RepID=UPI003642ABC1